MGGFKLCRILGFEISVDWSWLLIFFLVVYTLASGYFPTLYKFDVATNWIMGVLAALLLFASVLVHELSHSVVARSYGTDVKGITLFLFGGVSQTAEEPKSAKEEFWMAIVGPLTSFALAGLFYILGGIGEGYGLMKPGVAILGYLAWINLFLAIFNLVPGFPLDGGRVLRSIIWSSTGNLPKATQYASNTGLGFGYLLMAFGFMNILAGNLIGGLWLIFIGWFLTGAARSSYQQMMIHEALSGVRIEQVMTTDVPNIQSDMSIRQFVDNYLLHHEFACYPVVSGNEIVGMIGADEVRSIPSEKWDFIRVGEIVHRIDGTYQVKPGDDAWNAVEKLANQEVCRLVVMDNNQIQGTVSRDTVLRLIQTKIQTNK